MSISTNEETIRRTDLVLQFLENALILRNEATSGLFEEIFGDRGGEHWWDEFSVTCEFDVIRLYEKMNIIDRYQLAQHLSEAHNDD